MTIVLSNDDVRALVTMPDVITALEDAYLDLAAGHGSVRGLTDSFAETSSSETLFKLATSDAIAPSAGVAATRIRTGFYRWPGKEGARRKEKGKTGAGATQSIGLVLLFDTATAELLAIIHDSVLSVLRLGATNALAARHLARSDTRVVALLGSGRQAGGMLTGLCSVRDIERVQCYSPDPERRTAFAKTWSERLGIEVVAVESAEAAVADADAVVCATNSMDPVYLAEWLRPGVHLCSIRGPEIAPDALRRVDRLIVFVREVVSTQLLPADIVLPEKHADQAWSSSELDFSIVPDLTDLISGRTPGRTSPLETTCFLNTIGTAYQFAAVGALVHRRAIEQGVGRSLPTTWFSQTE